MVLAVKQYNGKYTEEIRIFGGIPDRITRPIYTVNTVELKRVPIETSVSADAYASFKVNPDTTEIYVELKRHPQMLGYLDSWCVPYCQNDFRYYHKKDPYVYILFTFVKGRIEFDVQYGYQKYLHKDMPYSVHNKVDDTSRECQTFYRADIPDEAKDLCNFAPLDTIDIW